MPLPSQLPTKEIYNRIQHELRQELQCVPHKMWRHLGEYGTQTLERPVHDLRSPIAAVTKGCLRKVVRTPHVIERTRRAGLS